MTVSPPPPPPGRGRRMAPLLVGLIAFAAALPVFLQDQDFPYFYHPDEPMKVDQIVHATRNFHHPQLLLNTVALAAAVTRTPPDAQSIAVLGRRVAAFYAAAAVGLLALAVSWSCGAPAGTAAAALLICTAPLADVAHFFKEDTAFTFGLAAFLAALIALDRWPRRLTVALLGAALGLLISSKYIGVLALPPGLLFVRWRAARSPSLLRGGVGKCLGTAGLALFAVIVIVNFQVVLHFPATLAAITQEMRQVHSLPTGLSERVPHNYLGRTMARETPPLVVGFAALALLAPFLSRRRPRAVEWAVLGFPVLYWIAVSFSGKVSPRYYEPVAVLLSAGAVVGLHRVSEIAARAFPARRRAVAGGLFVVGAIAMLVPSVRGLARIQSDFRTDTRQDLARFIRTHLPARAVIAQDSAARLSSTPRGLANEPRLVQKILPPALAGPVADLGTLDELRAAGVTHVVTTKADSAPYLSKRPNKAGLDSPDNRRRRAFYEQLVRVGTPLWQARSSRPSYVRQELTLFALP